MSLQDRHAKSQNRPRFDQVPETQYRDINVVRGGVPIEEVRGGVRLPDNKSVNEMRGGIPAPYPSYGDDPQPVITGCTAITKKGNPCKAQPITGTNICIGHSRVTVGD